MSKAKKLLLEYVQACCEGDSVPDPVLWLRERRAATASPTAATFYRVVEQQLLEMTALEKGGLNEHTK